MRGEDWLDSLAAPSGGGAPRVEWLDVLIEADAQPHPAQWLQDKIGVSRKSAERYRAAVGSGKGGVGAQPARGQARINAQAAIDELQEQRDAEAAGADRDDVADLIDAMSRMRVGRVRVQLISSHDGDEEERDISEILDRMHPGLSEVADAWRDGNDSAAADALSASVIARYGKEDSDNRDGLAAVLRITDYIDGIRYE